jgi:hypothetical protein
MKLLIMQFSPASYCFIPLRPMHSSEKCNAHKHVTTSLTTEYEETAETSWHRCLESEQPIEVCDFILRASWYTNECDIRTTVEPSVSEISNDFRHLPRGECILFFYPWSRALLEKPSVVQLLKNFPILYGTRKFITVLTRVRHWSLS